MTDTATLDQPSIRLSDRAAARLAEMIAAEGQPNLMLRIAVSGGGCSGFQYGFSFDDTVNPDDRTFTHGGVTAVIDEMSLQLLNGAEIDYVEDLAGAAFKVHNPNAASSCGCGSSFSI
ncbi:MAG: iron-sulfur cluster insertion protein ErpA [Alphaproteobacteria bacterium]|nr:MAG: iron-sulfur cluster insertion protein ErpA [Alphaproteobacteria bacterium]